MRPSTGSSSTTKSQARTVLGSRSSVASTMTTPAIASSRMMSTTQNPQLKKVCVKKEPTRTVAKLAIIVSPIAFASGAFSHTPPVV